MQVPGSVSRKHCQMEIDSNTGNYYLVNLNPQNATFVNGTAISRAIIQRTDLIELGHEHYRLDNVMLWDILDNLPKQTATEIDISFLRDIWNNYQVETKRLQKRTSFMTLIRGFIPVLTIGAVVMMSVMGRETQPIIYIPILLFIIGISILAIIDYQRAPKLREANQKMLFEKYRCPHCQYFFGYNTAYEVIENNFDKCPKCGKKLTRSKQS